MGRPFAIAHLAKRSLMPELSGTQKDIVTVATPSGKTFCNSAVFRWMFLFTFKGDMRKLENKKIIERSLCLFSRVMV